MNTAAEPKIEILSVPLSLPITRSEARIVVEALRRESHRIASVDQEASMVLWDTYTRLHALLSRQEGKP